MDMVAADYSHLRRINPVVSEDFQEDVIDGIYVSLDQKQGIMKETALSEQ